ncbi:2-methylcitrate dehydratase PrpD [Sphingomonas kaistensis]|uniref:2-methylcitrate dehydratase PrpD n=1 Tax=Sphingomonas kaistensis TaxID=298708 RepID=A0A7X6BEL4_9SPHN|nr:MmgE/PrpD family protein [Sphingomonas kaistensis]NJC04404.1 2-methylcitrate dehydratase PrpD [Sphingomonas kaistensis]
MFSGKAISDEIAAHMAMPGERLPRSAIRAARRALLDAYGVMLGATGLSEDVLPYRRLAESEAGPARLIGSRRTSSVSRAALANGALAHALDYGDTFDAGPAHPHAALVPALLALASARREATLGELLDALALGGDLACRLSLAPARPFEEGGWYPPPLVNLLAGAAACARFLGLDDDGIRAAMGLAMLQGAFPGEIKYDAGSPIRGVREAFAARGAVDATLLAAGGAGAFAQPLEGRAGFFAVYGGGGPGSALLDRLGERFLGEEMSFKPWPSCRGTHPYIEAALQVRNAIEAGDIDRIEAETGPIQAMLMRHDPKHPGDAKFSIPFTVATALLHGEVGLLSFLPERLADPAIRELAGKVGERPNPAWGREQAASGSLTIHLRDGRKARAEIAIAAGDPRRPLSDDDLEAKFAACAALASEPWSATRSADFCAALLGGAPQTAIAELFD